MIVRSRAPKLHPTTRYATAVVSGEIVAGEMVRLACARHLRDLERQGTEEFPYWFDEERASRAFDFYEFELHHYEGDLDREPFELLDWQMFVVGSIYGWVDEVGARRFRTVFLLTGKGSGKTPLGAGMALRALVDDEEPGAQVYTAATTREQAALAFKDARAMARKSPRLHDRLHVTEHAITFENSYFQTVSSEAGNLHGKRPHFALIDEIHVHPDDEVVEALRAGTKGRRQALIFMPTNAGQDRRSLAWRYQEYSRRVVSGVVTDEQWFAYVCQLDVCAAHVADGRDMPVDECETGCDQWTDEAVWLKANPSLPVVPGYRYLREQVNEAQGMPAKADIVKRLNFCIWTSGRVAWIRSEVWQLQAPPRKIRNRVGFAGYDLSEVNDITAAAYVFYDGQDAMDIKLRCFLPESRIDVLARQSRAPYRRWVDEGHLILTPGETIDYDFLEREDERMRTKYRIAAQGIDPWHAGQFASRMEKKGLKLERVSQTNQSLHDAVEEVERLLQVKGIRHGGNPLLAWVASNAILNIDARGFKRIDKQASPEKIDPLAAILNAVSVALTNTDVPPGPSVYEARGVLSL